MERADSGWQQQNINLGKFGGQMTSGGKWRERDSETRRRSWELVGTNPAAIQAHN
jgi:hypothetical protein